MDIRSQMHIFFHTNVVQTLQTVSIIIIKLYSNLHARSLQ